MLDVTFPVLILNGTSVAEVESVHRDSATGFAMALATPLAHPERHRHFLVLQVDVEVARRYEETLNGEVGEPR